MTAATRKRKTATSLQKPSFAATGQQGIQAFGKISKSQSSAVAKRSLGKEELGPAKPRKSNSIIRGSKRRKLADIQDDCDSAFVDDTVEQASSPIKCSEPAAAPLNPTLSAWTEISTPCKQSLLRSSNTETPTKGARSRLESIALTSSSPVSDSSLSSTDSYETPPSSPICIDSPGSNCKENLQLPDELQDLINLHSSFLTALALHYAHNGSMTPADLRILTPTVERSWRKRKVTLEDVRRILALERSQVENKQERVPQLYLSDFGNRKICVENGDKSTSQQAHRRPVNEEALNQRFAHNLEQEWISYITTQSIDPSPLAFISTLSLLPITLCSSLSQTNILLSKGQRRLEDLKAGAIKAQHQKPLSTTTGNTTPHQKPNTKQTASRSTDLLSRIRAKQLHQSTLPLPPSAEVLARKSALQRLTEISPVLESLVVSSKKHDNDDALHGALPPRQQHMSHASFTMPTMVQHLQMSLRNPIGKEEAVRCARLLAELAPEWIAVREVGKLTCVIVRGLGVGREQMARRISFEMEKM